MVSTRDINSVSNYNLFKNENKNKINYNLNYDSTHNRYNLITELGTIQKSGSDILSQNHTDVESFLRGTYFNNLEENKKTFTADLKERDVLSFYKRPMVCLPYPFISTTKKSRFI